jgi:hypothetical protein
MASIGHLAKLGRECAAGQGDNLVLDLGVHVDVASDLCGGLDRVLAPAGDAAVPGRRDARCGVDGSRRVITRNPSHRYATRSSSREQSSRRYHDH